MSDISITQVATTFRMSPEKILAHLVAAGIKGKDVDSTLTDKEKNTLKTHFKSKVSKGRQTITSSIKINKKPTVQTQKGVRIIRRKKTAIDDNENNDENQSQENIDDLKKHQESIELSKKKEQLFLSQEEKRQDIIRKQTSNKTQDEVKPQTENTTKEQKTTTDKTTTTTKNYKKKEVSYTTTGYNKGNRKLKKKDKTRLSQKLREDQSQQHAFVKPVNPVIHQIAIDGAIKVSNLAQQMSVKAGEVLKQMMTMGVMATVNDIIDQDTAMLVVEEMGHTAVIVDTDTIEDVALSSDDLVGDKLPRPPVIAVMGHVDHGKTSLLDYIRNTKTAKDEAGGITQHIGAYQVDTNKGKITFLDTPGHSAFTKMRSRGANATDIVILVVAADDGVMPETLDSIKHAKAANSTIIVAINKIDKEGANVDKVRQILANHDVVSEQWGGDVIMVPVSAHTGDGIDELLENINLQAEILELKAITNARAKGVVLEARIEKGRGKVATILVQEGTLVKDDIIIAGLEYGKVKQIISDTGKMLKLATPSMAVEVLGLSGVPEAGDAFVVLESDKLAKEMVSDKRIKDKELRLQKNQAIKAENFMEQMQHANVQKLNVLLKSDVRGSAQALVEALEALSIDDLHIKVVSSGVGGINDSDINLALASNAVVLGFNVRADAVARKNAERNNVDIKYYSVIYNLIDDIKAMMSGLLAPELSENIVGVAEVKEIFKSKALGDIAGSIVLEGKVKRNSPIRVLRDSVVIYEGELESLRRFKDEVKEVISGVECGIGVKDYNNVQVGDQIEVFERIHTPVKL